MYVTRVKPNICHFSPQISGGFNFLASTGHPFDDLLHTVYGHKTQNETRKQKFNLFEPDLQMSQLEGTR